MLDMYSLFRESTPCSAAYGLDDIASKSVQVIDTPSRAEKYSAMKVIFVPRFSSSKLSLRVS
jgi:hypothetical protein